LAKGLTEQLIESNDKVDGTCGAFLALWGQQVLLVVDFV